MKKRNNTILDISGDITLDELDIIINELKIGSFLVNQAKQYYQNKILLEKSKWWIGNCFGKNFAVGKEYKTFIDKSSIVNLRSLASNTSDLNELRKNLMKLIRDKRKLDEIFINRCVIKIQQALKLVKNIETEYLSISVQDAINKIFDKSSIKMNLNKFLVIDKKTTLDDLYIMINELDILILLCQKALSFQKRMENNEQYKMPLLDFLKVDDRLINGDEFIASNEISLVAYNANKPFLPNNLLELKLSNVLFSLANLL